MKIEKLAEIVSMLALNHRGAEVLMVYRAKHGKGYSNIQKPITGYRAAVRLAPGKILLEVDGARSYDDEEPKEMSE